MLISRVLSRIPKNATSLVSATSKLENRRCFFMLSNTSDFHHGSSREFAPPYQASILNNSTLASAFQRRAVSSSTFPERARSEKEERGMNVFSHAISIKTEEDEYKTLYPGISYVENQLRWGFIRKVYGILGAQVLLTTVVSSLTVHYTPVHNLIPNHLGIYLSCALMSFGLLWSLLKYQRKHPVNFLLLGLFTASLSLPVSVSCANTDSKALLQALVLTSSMVASLTGYTFWASKMGKDFNYMGPYLFSGLSVLLVTSIMQIWFPLGPTSSAVYGALSAMLFSGYIVYDTDNLIKRFSYDEYIPASVALYLDVANLFLVILDAMSDRMSDMEFPDIE